MDVVGGVKVFATEVREIQDSRFVSFRFVCASHVLYQTNELRFRLGKLIFLVSVALMYAITTKVANKVFIQYSHTVCLFSHFFPAMTVVTAEIPTESGSKTPRLPQA